MAIICPINTIKHHFMCLFLLFELNKFVSTIQNIDDVTENDPKNTLKWWRNMLKVEYFTIRKQYFIHIELLIR